MRRTHYIIAVPAATFIAMTALLVWWKMPSDQQQQIAAQPTAIHSQTETNSIASAVIAASKTNSDQQFITGLENLPPSLHDTEVDGGFELDADGNLIITNRIRQLFDYFLSTQGEEPLPTIVQRLRAYIHNTLSGDAAAEAEQLLENYIGYLDDVAALDAPITPDKPSTPHSYVRKKSSSPPFAPVALMPSPTMPFLPKKKPTIATPSPGWK